MVYRFYCMALFYSQTRRHVIKINVFGHKIVSISLFINLDMFWVLIEKILLSTSQHTFWLTLFLSNFFFSKTLSECQMVWILIRTDILSVLTWLQIVCKGYQQTPEVPTSNERVKREKKHGFSGLILYSGFLC